MNERSNGPIWKEVIPVRRDPDKIMSGFHCSEAGLRKGEAHYVSDEITPTGRTKNPMRREK